jgi:hypothetical protein
MRISPVTTNYFYLQEILTKVFKKDSPLEDKSMVAMLVNACLLGDPPNKSNPNFLPDFLQSFIVFNKFELSEQQCKKKAEIHFLYKDAINIAKHYLTLNLLD